MKNFIIFHYYFYESCKKSAKNNNEIAKSTKLSQNKNQNPTKRTRKYADLN